MHLLSNDRLDWGMEVTTVRFCFTLFKVNDMKCYAREGCTTDGLITIIETETINDIVQSILPWRQMRFLWLGVRWHVFRSKIGKTTADP